MKKNSSRDSIIKKNVAIATVDAFVVTIDTLNFEGLPVLAIAWGMAKGLFGAGIQLRQDRAIEFLEQIRDKKDIFSREVLQSREFQDGFVYVFEKYLTQRNKDKRGLIRQVFIGFSVAEDKENFLLERIISTIELITLEEIVAFRIFTDGTIRTWHKEQFPEASEEQLDELDKQPLNTGQIGKYILGKMCGRKEFEKLEYTEEILSRLSGMGMLLSRTGGTWGSFGTFEFRLSAFGYEFSKYVLND